MKNIYSLLSIILCFGFAGKINAQSNSKSSKQLPSLNAAVGIMSFGGDIGPSKFSKQRVGYNFSVSQGIGRYMELSLGVLLGTITDSEKSSTSNNNFESKITQPEFKVEFHLDKTITPFIASGVGYLLFDPFGDLLDANGNQYYYWLDGSIKDIDENAPNASSAVAIKRDFTYETKLTDSLINYERNTLTVPLSAGIKANLKYGFSLKLGATYYLTFTDWIDNVKSGGNDALLYSSLALKYTFGKAASEEGSIQISGDDSDNDGVSDLDDMCPGTPEGLTVDKRGCLIDKDEDGVPDYKDVELDTEKGAVVDENGATLTKEMQVQKHKEFNELASGDLKSFKEKYGDDDSANSNNEVENSNDGTDVSNKDMDASSENNIPMELRLFDNNSDGVITTTEINSGIDRFFEGEEGITVDKLNKLIDYFFEQ